MLIDVRPATPLDIDWLISRLLKLSQFAGTKRLLFEDNEYMRNGERDVVEKHVMFIAEKTDAKNALACGIKNVGFIGGYFVGHPFNPNVRYLSELFWWVDEDERGSSAGYRLLRAFIDFGKQNADWLVFGLNEKTPVKEESILKLGFKFHESCYLMVIN